MEFRRASKFSIATNISKRREYDAILARHGLDPSDTFKTVCDNASNMKKAFKVSMWEDRVDEDDELEDVLEHNEVDKV